MHGCILYSFGFRFHRRCGLALDVITCLARASIIPEGVSNCPLIQCRAVLFESMDSVGLDETSSPSRDAARIGKPALDLYFSTVWDPTRKVSFEYPPAVSSLGVCIGCVSVLVRHFSVTR